MTKDLERIDDSLKKLQEDFNRQLDAIEDDTHSFHKAMIELSAKNPEHKELVQFIVFVNDKLETKHKTHSEVMVESLNEMINVKRKLIHSILDKKQETNENMGFFRKIFNSTKIFADLKITLISIAAIAVAVVIMVSPDTVLTVIKALAELILG